MKVIAVGLALALAAPATAQNTATTCSQIGTILHCDSQTQQRADYSSLLNAPDPGAAVMESLNAAQEEQAQQQVPSPPPNARADGANYSRAIRTQVGEYLKAGDCETAMALALRAGEIALANEAKVYCAKP